jgi:hypothetical protein
LLELGSYEVSLVRDFCLLLLIATQSLVVPMAASGAPFVFGNNMNELTGFSSKTLTADLVQLQISVHNPVGATFIESDPAGLTIDSSAIPSIVDSEGPGKINRIAGPGLPADAAEALKFSYNTPGVLTGINFDGIKDESLEYFLLTSTGGLRVNFFDSAANLTNAGAVDAAIAAGAVTGTVVYLKENAVLDDEAPNLHIPFMAGQEFVLSYGELGSEFGATETGNGARLQGLTAQSVPEPTALGIIIGGSGLFICLRRRRSTTPWVAPSCTGRYSTAWPPSRATSFEVSLKSN